MEGLLSPLGIASLILAAGIGAVLGGIVYMVFIRRWERRKHRQYVETSALKLREGLLAQYPPGPRPEIRITAVDDLAEEQWEYLIQQKLGPRWNAGARG